MTTEPLAFYRNYLEPFATSVWATCSTVKTNLNIVDITDVMTPIYLDGVYSFVLVVEERYYYYEFTGVLVENNKFIMKGPKDRLPKDQTHLYLEETIKLLSHYREPLNEFSIIDLDERLENLSNKRYTIPQFPDFAPRLFYLNLLDRVGENQALFIVKPGSDPHPLNNNNRVIIRPVYGPSHNPLQIEFGNGEMIKIIFRRGTQIKNENNTNSPIKEIDIDVEEYYSVGQSIPLLILALVSRLAQSKSLESTDMVKMIRDEFVLKRALDKRAMSQISLSRLSLLEEDVLWAAKLCQLAYQKAPVETKSKEALLLIQEIRKAYRAIGGENDVKNQTIKTLKNMIQDYHDVQQ